jgi:hypothetical protein
VDDIWLDTEFENKLARSGDHLAPIPDAPKLVELLFPKDASADPNVSSNGSAAAAARALDIRSMIPDLDAEAPADKTVSLGENPSETELLEFARSHPVVRSVLRTFRGKIVEVRKL